MDHSYFAYPKVHFQQNLKLQLYQKFIFLQYRYFAFPGDCCPICLLFLFVLLLNQYLILNS
jgi:hypothetical protein